MTLSLKEWAEYRDLLSKLSQKASDEFKDAVWNVNGRWHGAGLGAIPRDDLIEYAHALVTKYSEGSSELACQMYDKIAKLSKKTLPPAEPAETASMQDVAKALNGTIKTSQNQDYVSSTVGRFVKQASQDTTLKNAKRDGAEFAWIPSGDPCPYCIMLAANGWRRVGKNGSTHADHIHNNCNCAYAVRFDSSTEIKGYDPDVYKEQYDEAEGRSSKDKVNSMRRMQYQENKDRINEQKREAYAERQNKNNDLQSIMMDNPRNFPQRDYVNDGNTVNSILSKMSYDNNDEELKQYVRHSIGMMEESEFKLLDDVDVRIVRTEGNNAFVRTPQIDENGHKVYTIKINPDDLMEFGFAHEYTHLACEELDLINDKEFVKVLENVSNTIEAISPAIVGNDTKLYAVVQSPLFVDYYQGRTYIEFDKHGLMEPLKTEHLVEYMTTGYEYYLGNPNLLEEKDILLYNYFKKRGLGK